MRIIGFSNCERLKLATYHPSNTGNLNLKAGDLLLLIEAIKSRIYPLTFKRDKFDWIGAQGLNLADSSNLNLNTHYYVANGPALSMLLCAVQFVQQKSINFLGQMVYIYISPFPCCVLLKKIFINFQRAN